MERKKRIDKQYTYVPFYLKYEVTFPIGPDIPQIDHARTNERRKKTHTTNDPH